MLGGVSSSVAMPTPGRPESLGVERDRADAAAIMTVHNVVRTTLARGVPPAWPNHLAREALYDLWERPRLPQPLVGPKYPVAYPWSSEARRLYESLTRPALRGQLVLEHLAPRAILIGKLVQQSASLTVNEFLQLIQQGVVAAVITNQEDKTLGAAKVGKSYPAGADPVADPWCRYRFAGLDLAGFEPLVPPGAAIDNSSPHAE